MSNWDGKERRSMNQDQIDRDRLLTEIHSDMKHILNWSEKHDASDDKRFKEVNLKTDWTIRIACMGIGGLVVLQFILKILR